MQKRLNPLFADTAPKEFNMLEQIESAVTSDAFDLSPISKKKMKRVTCDNIPAYIDEENRLIVPVKM